MTDQQQAPPSGSTPPRSLPRMQLVGEQRTADPPPSPSPTGRTTPTPSFSDEFQHRAAWKAGVMGALGVVTQVLALRLLVLVAIIGGVGLTWMALAQPDPFRLGALVIYGLLIVVPVIWLAGR